MKKIISFIILASFLFTNTAYSSNLRVPVGKIKQERFEAIANKEAKSLILYSGPSAAGKSPLWEQIKKYFPSYFSRIVLYTSRDMRPGEEEGVDYKFRSVKEIKQMALENPEHFVTLEVNTDLQGLDMRDVEQAMQNGQVGIAEVSVDWAAKLRERYPDKVFTVFISPFSNEDLRKRATNDDASQDEVIKQEMLQRQNERHAEKPTPEAKRKARAKGAIREMSMRTLYDAIIVNSDLRDISAHQDRWDGDEGKALVEQFMQYVLKATFKKPTKGAVREFKKNSDVNEIKIAITEILKKGFVGDKQRFLKLWQTFSKLKDKTIPPAETKEYLKKELISKLESKNIKAQLKEIISDESVMTDVDKAIDNTIKIIADSLSPAHLSNYIKDTNHGFDHCIRLFNTLMLLENNNNTSLINIKNFIVALFMHDLGHFIQGYKHNISSRYIAESLLEENMEKLGMTKDDIIQAASIIEAHNHRDLRDKSVYEKFYGAKLIKDLDAFDSASDPSKVADIGVRFNQALFIDKWSLVERLKVLIFDNDDWNRNNPQLIGDEKKSNYDSLTHLLFTVVIERLPSFYKTKEMQDMVAKKYKYDIPEKFKSEAEKSLYQVIEYVIKEEKDSGSRVKADLERKEKEGIGVSFKNLIDFILWYRSKDFDESFLCGIRDNDSEEQGRIKYLTERMTTFFNEVVYDEILRKKAISDLVRKKTFYIEQLTHL